MTHYPNNNHIGDMMLQWMSINHEGKIQHLRDAMHWLVRSDGVIYSERSMGFWLSEMVALGHCEIDWFRNEWRISPSRVVRLPNADGSAVYVGARASEWSSRLSGENIYIEEDLSQQSVSRLPLPKTAFLRFDNYDDVRRAASALGAQYCGVQALMLSDSLSPAAFASAAPPAETAELERFEKMTPWTWITASGPKSRLKDGLYREVRFGRRVFYLKREETWLKSDLGGGLFAELKRSELTPFRWKETVGRPKTGTVYLKREAALPTAHRRALTLCSGRVAEEVGASGVIAYLNVPWLVYAKVAASLLGNNFEELEIVE